MWGFLSRFVSLLKRALNAAVESGLTDEVVHTAYQWAKVAANKFVDNAEKREFVVRMLVAKGVPESLARLATELGVRLLKAELAKERF